MNRRASSRRGREEGSAAVEAAFVLPLLMLFVIGSIEFGRVLWTYHTMLLAVEEGGRYAMIYGASPTLLSSACPNVNPVTLANCAAARANTYLANYHGTGITATATADASTPANITISANYTFNFVTPLLRSYGPINLSSRVIVPSL